MNKTDVHTFHIPVMGTGFTVDTPVKVAHLGISSAISLSDDFLMEKMREFYCTKLNKPFRAIPVDIEDYRAKRITAYLNLIDEIVKEKFNLLKNSILEKGSELEKYIDLLPDFSILKQKFNQMAHANGLKNEILNWIRNNLTPGSIDVNIMTKVDKDNYRKNEKLPVEYNDAHAALRGFAMSTLSSSVILSAGVNTRLYSYFANFDDFFPDENGNLKKKILLKVSDYRSALIQGKFLAKKGLWVSEYRVESGLNCGGHAFATDGHLMGPILEEFKYNRNQLIESTHDVFVRSLKSKGRTRPDKPLQVKITAQGGIGTKEEHEFLIEQYELDSVGWATPFLLVPEVTNVDDSTLKLLGESKEDDLYLSNISPLGVKFNSIRGNSRDIEKMEKVKKGKPGSHCPKKYLIFNTEYTDRGICTASRQYQKIKIDDLNVKQLEAEEHEKEFAKIIDKSCICLGLATSAMLVNKLDMKGNGNGVTICPGPNIAYFSDTFSLKEMVDHIYGKINILNDIKRPNMFIKELKMYIDYLKEKIDEFSIPVSEKQHEYIDNFQKNIALGIEYYKDLFSNIKLRFEDTKTTILNDLQSLEEELKSIKLPFADFQTSE